MPFTAAEPHPAGGYVFSGPDTPPTHLMGDAADGMAQHIQNLLPPAQFTPADAQGMQQAEARPVAAIPVAAGPVVDPHAGQVFVPGHAAVQEGYVPATRTVQGGLNLSPEQQRQMDDAVKMHREQADAFSAEQMATAAKQQSVADEQRAYWEKEAVRQQEAMGEAERQRARLQAEQQRVMAPLMKDSEAIGRMQVDPRRLFHGDNGAVNSITSAIAVGLGAMGAAITHTPNYAAQIIDATIQRDIDAQTKSIETRRDANATALANIQRKYGIPLDEASKVLQAHQLQYAQARANQFAAQTGTLDAQQRALALGQQLNDKRVQTLTELAEMTAGRQTTVERYQPGMAASRGGYRDKTEKELMQEEELRGKRLANAKAEQDLAEGPKQDKGTEERIAAGEEYKALAAKQSKLLEGYHASGAGKQEIERNEAAMTAAMMKLKGLGSRQADLARQMSGASHNSLFPGESGPRANLKAALQDVDREMERLRGGKASSAEDHEDPVTED